MVREAEQVRSSIGLTGQYAAVDEFLTGYENLLMMGKLYRLHPDVAKRRAKGLLEQFDLADASRRAVKTYSGGMRRRLDLAASLIASPPIIFLDEPTTGLDPRSRSTMWEIIERLVKAGTTILLTTQHLEEADRLANRIAVLDQGKIIAEGTADELKRRVGSERLELTIAADSDFAMAKSIIDGESLQTDERNRTLSLVTSNGVRQTKQVLDQLEHAGVMVETLSLHKPTLDDVFLTFTGHEATKTEEAQETAEHPVVSIVAEAVVRERHTKVLWALRNSAVLIQRSMKHIVKNPDQLLSVAFSPIMFLLLFRYVFGGAINTGGTTYVNYLIAGILVQMATFGASTTAFSVATDLKQGIVDRFRSLPMFSPSLLIGHVVADLARNIVSTVIMIGVGFLVGFRPNANPVEWALVLGLLLVFTFAISWLSAIMGLLAKSIEAVQWLSFVIIFPLTFASSAFVPTDSMPAGLKIFAENQPVTHVIEAMRGWLVGTPVGNHAWIAFVWFTALSMLSIPVAAKLFRRYKAV